MAKKDNGATQPSNLEAERSLIGALLIDSDAIVRVADSVRSEDFYDEKHQKIYQAIEKLYEKHSAIDVLTVSDNLSSSGFLDVIGGSAYLTELTNYVPTSSHIEEYANIVSQKGIRRRLIRASKAITEYGYDEEKPIQPLIESAETDFFNVSQQHVKQDIASIEDILAESFERLDDLHKDKGKIRGVATGLKDLDTI